MASRRLIDRGFAHAELCAVVVVGVVVLALAMVIGGDGRRSGRLADDLARMRQLGQTTAAYGADYRDRFWHFSWRAGDLPSEYPDLQQASSDIDAMCCQAIDLLRRRAGRPDMPRITSWIPGLTYSHLVLADYFDAGLPNFGMICAEDKNLRIWAADPEGFDAKKYIPYPDGTGTSQGKRYPYRSSIEIAPALWSSPASGSSAFAQAGVYNQFTVPGGAMFGGCLLSDVAHPSQKIEAYETFGRHFGPRAGFLAHKEARNVVLFVDGNASTRLTADGNEGWWPSDPTSGPTTFYYKPDPDRINWWEPRPLSGGASDLVVGHYRWTRGSWMGRDFGGPEVQP